MLVNKSLIFIISIITLFVLSCESDDKLTLCNEGYVSLNSSETCYSNSDSSILQNIIEDNNIDLDDLSELGYQEWENGHLITLDLSNENLISIPLNISDFNALQNLNIGFNNLDQIPVSISELSSLQFLSLYSNNLTEFPDFLGEIESLLSLYVSYNSLENASLTNWESIEYLYLDNNNLDEIIFNNTPNLHSLFLHNNSFSEIPVTISNLSLITLDLSSNQIISIDENQLCELNNDIKIDLADNNICSDNNLGDTTQANCSNLGGTAIDCTTIPFFGQSCTCFEDLNNNGQFDNYDDWNIVDGILYCSNGKEITLYLDSCE